MTPMNGQLPVRRKPVSSPGFRGGRTPRPNDAFIAVMGVTGSGKSSFISLCSGKAVKIGHDLNACTSVVDVYAYEESPDRTVYLIDTPGFDDTSKSDTEVLSEIAAWMGDSYRSDILLNGILYLHRIADIRMQGSAKKNLLMFKELCGTDALKKVVLVTTMWDKVAEDEAVKREKELTETPEFWGWMLGKGSTFHRHSNTEESARDIVYRLIQNKGPVATDLQKQLIDEQRTLDQTSAGRELQSELLKEKEKWTRERDEMEAMMRAAIRQRDHEMENDLREERDRYAKLIQKVESDTGALRSTMESLISQRDARVVELERQMKAQQDAHDEERSKMREQREELEKVKTELEEKEKVVEAEREQSRNSEQASKPVFVHQPNSDLSRVMSVVQSELAGNRPPFSVAIYGSTYVCSCRKQQISNTESPKLLREEGWIESSWLASAAFGEGLCWMARYSDGMQVRSTGIAERYPELSEKLSTNGLGELDFIALGPENSYFARWDNESWSSFAETNINDDLKKYATKIMAMAFGIGGSYVISYGSSWNPSGLSYRYVLNGCYPDLEQFIKMNKSMEIAAIALDPLSKTDYILIWTSHHGFGTEKMRCFFSDKEISDRIYKWWNDIT